MWMSATGNTGIWLAPEAPQRFCVRLKHEKPWFDWGGDGQGHRRISHWIYGEIMAPCHNPCRGQQGPELSNRQRRLESPTSSMWIYRSDDDPPPLAIVVGGAAWQAPRLRAPHRRNHTGPSGGVLGAHANPPVRLACLAGPRPRLTRRRLLHAPFSSHGIRLAAARGAACHLNVLAHPGGADHSPTDADMLFLFV